MHRNRAISPQLRALGPDIRVLAVFVDAIAAFGGYCEQVQARIDTAWLIEAESGEGWTSTPAERLMQRRGWKSTKDIYESADIKPNHWPVLELHTRGYDTREIANHTGLPLKTVWQWLDRDLIRLRNLDLGELDEAV